jgi:hypothetical protein
VKYFPLWYRLKAEDRFLIWVWNEQNEQTYETLLAVDAAGLIPSFANLPALREYAASNGYVLEKEKPRLHDLDWVATWTASPGSPVNCKKALAAWNLFADVSASARDRGSAFKRLDSRSPKTIYEKVVLGEQSAVDYAKGGSVHTQVVTRRNSFDP